MPVVLEYFMLAAIVIATVLLFLLWQRLRHPMGGDIEKALRAELREAREESSRHARELREEVIGTQAKSNETLVKTVNMLGDDQKQLLDGLSRSTKDASVAVRTDIEKLIERTTDGLKHIQISTENKLEVVRQTTEKKLADGDDAQQKRSEQVLHTIQTLSDALKSDMATQRDRIALQLSEIQRTNEDRFEKVRTTLEEKIKAMADDQNTRLELVRQTTETKLQAGEDSQQRRSADVVKTIQALTESIKTDMASQRERLHSQLQDIQKANEDRFDKVRLTLDEKLRGMGDDQRKHLAEVVAALKNVESGQQQEQAKSRELLNQKFEQIQASNEKKLEEMRQTVDEKLHSTLEKRLGESFKLVSERLEAVQRGLGEMQTLATGVGDLKRVLGNVKERGTWGEYQLGAILAEILTPDQYAQNVRTKEGREAVEFAVKLPGRGVDHGQPVWLPIDAKFPKEAYERLVEASRAADAERVQSASDELRRAVAKMAKDISEKYINPPASTDFAILFLPTEGLYAEVLRQPGLHDELQQKCRVLVAGPTTLSAILNSLRIGFQTLAIEKRASEVWNVLGAVKTEFGKFGDVLDRVKKQITTVSNTLDESSRRTRAMERKLRSVEQLPAGDAKSILALGEGEASLDENESVEGDLAATPEGTTT